MKNHNSLGYKQPSDLGVKLSHDVKDVFWPIPGLISCTGMTRSVGITCHAKYSYQLVIYHKGLSIFEVACTQMNGFVQMNVRSMCR